MKKPSAKHHLPLNRSSCKRPKIVNVKLRSRQNRQLIAQTINALFTNGHIAQMTSCWLSFGHNHQEYQRFTRRPKYIKLFLPADQSSLVAVVPKKRISSFVDSLLPGQSRKNKTLTSRTLHTNVMSLKTRLFQMKQIKLR